MFVDETGCDASLEGLERASLEGGRFTLHMNGKTTFCGEPEAMKLKGRHNHINMLCAMAACKTLGVDEDTIKKACESFTGLSHRIETVAIKDNVIFVDDSKGTNPEATVEAVMAFPYPQALILGGYDKGSDYAMLIPYMKGRVAHVLLIGATTEKFKVIFGGDFHCVEVRDMKEAVAKGYELLEGKGVVLLSPACASFDMYKSFEARGDDFADCARKFSSTEN